MYQKPRPEQRLRQAIRQQLMLPVNHRQRQQKAASQSENTPVRRHKPGTDAKKQRGKKFDQK
jgi:hypothetical protein